MWSTWVAVLCAILGCILPALEAANATAVLPFPAKDACRRRAQYAGIQLEAMPPKNCSDGVMRMCFKVKARQGCQPEYFTRNGKRVQARCCSTTFAKVKIYVNPACKWQFGEGDVIVPSNGAQGSANSERFNQRVSPSWAGSLGNNEVKYTQFGPIPHDIVDGTQLCIRMYPDEGPCSLNGFTGITNPAARALGIFQVAIYDRKQDGYECCPIFTFPMQP